MIKNYYHLVSSLPELLFESEDSKNYDFMHIREYILEEITGKDSSYVHDLLCNIDNYNLITVLYSKNRPWKKGGRFQVESLSDLRNLDLPKYMLAFLTYIESYEEENKLKPGELIAEKQLYELCYNEMENSGNPFIAKWFKFDREVKNIQAAFVGRQLDVVAEEFLVKEDDITELLVKNSASDFGLSRERDYMPKLFQALETQDLLERENKLDMFRWNQIDEFNTFEYFTIDVALGILKKAYIADRWMKLDEEEGKIMFRKLVDELKNSYKKEKK